MTKVIATYLAGPDEIDAWQTALQTQVELAPLWLRDRKLTPREIAFRICARVATIPNAPLVFQDPTAHLESLATVLEVNLRPRGKAFRLPDEIGTHAGGRGSGRTSSSWQIATEMAEALGLHMPRKQDVRRRSRARKMSARKT